MFAVRGLLKPGAIGVDLGTRCVRLVQCDRVHGRLLAAARADLPATDPLPEEREALWVEGIRQARADGAFRGREAVLCLTGRELILQNVRVPAAADEATEQMARQESAGRLPFPLDEAEIRFVEAGEVKQGDAIRKEVIVMACPKTLLERALAVVEAADLSPVAVDSEPLAVVRCFASQLRRDEDRRRRTLYVHVGAAKTLLVMARGEEVLFMKYLDVGGRQWDEAVSRLLNMGLADAASFRRHNGERRSERKDPEISRTVEEAGRPVLDRLAHEVSMCLRYYSVTFRGQTMDRVVVCGGEATENLSEEMERRLDLPSELGDPLRSFSPSANLGRDGGWDVAVGLAMRNVG